MWNPDELRKIVQSKLADYVLVAVSNRQPFSHIFKGKKTVCRRQPGGVVTALHPVMEAVQGIWIATGATSSDRLTVDEHSKVAIPPERPSYTLKRLFLSKEDVDGYYYGYCNEGIWPLSHVAYTRPTFLASEWKSYEKVNRLFAQSVLEEVGNRQAFVWVQDFHLALVAKYLRESGAPNIITSLFWHMPWPNPEAFRICPQKNEILEGLLAYDLLGFQIRYHCDNFLSTVDSVMESRIDRERGSVFFKNRETLVRPFPISVDFQAISSQGKSPDIQERREKIREDFSLEGKKVLVGVDRIDYTKGIPDKFRAVDRFLEKYPEYREKVVLLQVGQVSRIHIPRYKELNDELNARVEEINWKHSQGSWVPIVLTRAYFAYEDILALYQLADVCIVSSLHDGMNLVAKEFAASRSDLDGVLILSQFTGASRELTDALLVNPYDTESFADSLKLALEMPAEEKEKRMRKMREVVEQHNIYRWAGKVLSQLLKFEFQEN